MEKHYFSENCENNDLPQENSHIFKKSKIEKSNIINQKSKKNRMFLGTWDIDFGGVLEGFLEGFGSQNPRFSHFVRCFFDVIFEERVRRAKNQPKRPNKTQNAQI